MGKNVAVFVDVANIFYAAKAAGVDIDYVTLLKSATAGRDFVRAYAYTGLDPDNENQRNFHSFLARNSYKVVSKDIRKYGDGKVKANLDIELVVDLMKTARNLDVAIVVSGDGDFAPAIRAVQEMGVRVEVISFRGNTSSDLIEVADLFTDITQLARVEKGSSRSGRRVAGDEEDLSMTEVPDKQTEGTGAPRGRGRGRGRGRPSEAEPVAARSRAAAEPRDVAPRDAAAAAGLTVLPGEKLSRVAAVAEVDRGDADEVVDDVAAAESIEATDSDATVAEGGPDGDGARRRRRRGGRGRGRGRGREQEAGVVADGAPAVDLDVEVDEEDEEEAQVAVAPRGPRPTPFGSVWDSQIGVPRPTTGPVSPVADDEDFEEPEIPEYLIAEQRRGQAARSGRGAPQGGRGGVRGGRAAYSAAIDRERYGRGGGGGINRYPDVSGREHGSRGSQPSQPAFGRQNRSDGPDRQDRAERSAGPRSSEPWSEVPEDLQAMLRAQLAQSGKGATPRPDRGRPSPSGDDSAERASSGAPVQAGGPDTGPAGSPAPRRRTTRRKPDDGAAETLTTAAPGADATAATSPTGAKPRATRRKATSASGDGAGEATPAAAEAGTTAPKARTTTRSRAAAAPATRGRSRAAAASPEAEVSPTEAGPDAEAPAAPKRRTTRKKADPA